MALKQLTTERLKSSVTSNDRMSLTMFLAFAFHLLLVLGISFSVTKTQQSSSRNIGITLVKTSSDRTNKDADYLGNENQEGSGNTRDKVRITDKFNVKSEKSSKGASTQDKMESSTEKQQQGKDKVLTKDERTQLEIANAKDQDKVQDTENVEKTQITRSSKDINIIKNELNRIQMITTKRKLKRKYVSASTRKHDDAAYIKLWSDKVRGIGNAHFPPAARKRAIGGYVKIAVSMTKGGAVWRIRTLKSSGSKILDEAVKRAIRIGSPYKPIPSEVIKNKDLYVIVNRYRFF